MVASTTMNVKIDSTPALRISSSEQDRVRGGPGWARAFLARISESPPPPTNQVELRDVPGGGPSLSLTVALTLPPFLPVPVAAFEKAGSQSIQKLLDQDMPITLSKFRDAYLAWKRRLPVGSLASGTRLRAARRLRVAPGHPRNPRSSSSERLRG